MEIDPRQQQATVNAQRATERQRRRSTTTPRSRLNASTSCSTRSDQRETYEQSQQAFQNSKADYEAATESRKTQEQLLAITRSARRSTEWW